MQTCILTLSLETADIFEEERELARQRDELAEKARKEQVPLLSACAVCVCVRCVCLCVCVCVYTRSRCHSFQTHRDTIRKFVFHVFSPCIRSYFEILVSLNFSACVCVRVCVCVRA
jgi:hypothetical protein